MGSDPERDSYAELPYPSLCYAHANIDALCALGRLFGLAPRPAERCRVLELGCASGGNLLPLAERWPASHFVGIDRSHAQIARAQTRARSLALGRVELITADIASLDPARLGAFDYIICHGVFSWVPAPVQDRLLALLPALLNPHGLALVSYNVYPGWHMREMLRKMMVYAGHEQDSALERVRAARAMVEFVGESLPARRAHIGAEAPTPFESSFHREREVVRRSPDAFLSHEHLERDNTPLLFHEFMARATQQRLRYLGDAQLDTMVTRDLPAELVEQLQARARDRIDLEQQLDFMRNRELRNTVLCRADAPAREHIDAGALASLRFAQHSKPSGELTRAQLDPGVPLSFALHGVSDERRAIRVSAPLTKAALIELCSRWPASVPFETLLAAACARLEALAIALPADPRAQLTTELIECLVRAAIVARVCEPPLARDLAAPKLSAFNRLVAAQEGWIAGLEHKPFILDPTLAQLVPLLDGREREALLEGLRERVAAGVLELRREGVPIPAGAALDQALREFAERSIETLARLPALSA